jgi:hypothetical protein
MSIERIHMARRKSKQSKLPHDWTDADPGLWMTTEPLAVKFEGGSEEILPAGTVVDLDYPQEIYGEYIDDEGTKDESLPYTNRYDNSRSYMRFCGKIGGRKMEFVEPFDAGNGGPFGLSNGVHYVRVGPLKPLSFPEYLPDGVALPPFWDYEKATKEDMCIGGPSGFDLDHAIGKRWLPCFRVDINDTYYAYISIDAPSVKTNDYWGRKDEKSPQGSKPRKTLSDFLAAAESLIFTVEPHAQYPRHGKRSVRFPASGLPKEWLEQMEYQERFDTDEEFRAEHFRKKEQDLRDQAFAKYRRLTWEEARVALVGGAFLERIKYQRKDNHFDSILVHAVITEDIFKWSWLRNDEPAAPYVLGFVPDGEIEMLVQQAKDHFNGLRDDSVLRIKRPNKRDQYVIEGDTRAETGPLLNARNLVDWKLKDSGTSERFNDGKKFDHRSWTGRTAFGGNWEMSLSRDEDGKWSASHERSRNRYSEGCDETDIHNYHNWHVSFFAENFDDAFVKARGYALREEASHLIGGGWYAAKAGIAEFSTDILELVALFEAQELGYTGDRSRRRHQPLPHRLAAIVWELKRRGSDVGWDLLDDSLGADLMEEYENDL